MAVIKSIEADNHRITIVGDGIIRVYSRGDVTIKGVESVFHEISLIANREKVLMLIDPTEEKSMNNEARKMIKQLGEIHCNGMAVITRKDHIKRIANILIKIDNPKFPLKMFTDNTQAENWLKSL